MVDPLDLPEGVRRKNHFYGDGCGPVHQAENPCEMFTTSSYVHAHDLGRVACVNCGHNYAAHQSGERDTP